VLRPPLCWLHEPAHRCCLAARRPCAPAPAAACGRPAELIFTVSATLSTCSDQRWHRQPPRTGVPVTEVPWHAQPTDRTGWHTPCGCCQRISTKVTACAPSVRVVRTLAGASAAATALEQVQPMAYAALRCRQAGVGSHGCTTGLPPGTPPTVEQVTKPQRAPRLGPRRRAVFRCASHPAAAVQIQTGSGSCKTAWVLHFKRLPVPNIEILPHNAVDDHNDQRRSLNVLGCRHAADGRRPHRQPRSRAWPARTLFYRVPGCQAELAGTSWPLADGQPGRQCSTFGN
jgi:hypothetical protein